MSAGEHRVPTYRRMPLVFTRGEGCRLFDASGRGYLDLLSGIGVNALGHAHPRLTEALKEQAGELLHLSNLYDHPLQEELAGRLAGACGLDLVFFGNSGTESVEAALKMARRFQERKGEHRPGLLALEGSFHGRSLGALSVTWSEQYRAPFEPLLPGVGFVPAEDRIALERELSSGRYAALILEPIQGEAGVVPLSGEYLRVARELTRETGTVLVLDEIQSGAGRTGLFLASQESGISPGDIVCLAKPLGAGLPIGATVATREVGESLGPGDHGSTFGGGALACRAASVFLSELFDHGLLEHVREIGSVLQDGLIDLERRHTCVVGQRGRGLMQALVLGVDAQPVVDGLAVRGLLANATAGNVLRFLPPFVIGRAEIAAALSILDAELGLNDSARQF